MRKGCCPTKAFLAASEVVIVLPNGCKEIIALKPSGTFSDLKRSIELQFGLPVELQHFNLQGFDHAVGDWVNTDILNGTNDPEIYINTDDTWKPIICACLRRATEKALDILSSIEDVGLIENLIFVALLISAAVGNEELLTTLIEEADEHVNINRRTSSGRTILHVAVAGGHWTCIEPLLSNFADGADLLHAKDDRSESPLDIAERTAEQTNIVHKIKTFVPFYGTQYCSLDAKSKEANPSKVERKTSKPLMCLPIAKQYSLQSGDNLRRKSTPSPPLSTRPTQTNRILHRPSLTLKLSKAISGSDSDLRRLSPKLSPGSSFEGVPSDLPPSSPISPVHLSANYILPTTQPRDFYQRGKNNTDEETPPATHSPATRTSKSLYEGGLQQIVHLPPWRRTGGFQSKEQEKERKISDHVSVVLPSPCDGNQNISEDDKYFEKYVRTQRAVSVATITAEEIKKLHSQRRLQRPWNQWRTILQSDEQVAEKATRDDIVGSRVKSFEEWFIDKSIERDKLLAQLNDEERRKALEKEKEDQLRRLRSKSYESWLVEKEMEEEAMKEEEKRHGFEKKKGEEKRKIRKYIAEQKYEKWVNEKFQEELKKEEELRQLMEEKWKVKEGSKNIRKSSVDPTLIKQALTKTSSMPLL